MYKNLRKIASIAVAILIFAPGSTQAALTIGSTSITSDAALTMNAVANTADAIYLHANGGTSETIKLHADQGTGVDSINLLSDLGGLTLQSSLASADAINLNAAVGGLDLDALTGLAINVTAATVASNITIAVDADAEDFTISTTGSAGDIFITSADDLTLTGFPVIVLGQLQVSGTIVLTGSARLTNGVVVYNDSDPFGDCTASASTSVDFSTGNHASVFGGVTTNCTISITNAEPGGLYLVLLYWQGPHDFILQSTLQQVRSLKQVCEADGSTLEDSGDQATLLIWMSGGASPTVVSCAVNRVND